MSSCFKHSPLVHHHYLICIDDGSQAMGDQKSRAILDKLADSFLDKEFILGIKIGGGFISNHNRGSLEEGPGECDPLDLSTAQALPSLADLRIISVG